MNNINVTNTTVLNKNELMSREAALFLLKDGKSLTHKYFTDEEYIKIGSNGLIQTEDNYVFEREFHHDPMFADGWSIKA